MNFEAIIGIEIHVEMKTKTKMFSSAPNSFGYEPNTLVSEVDMAFPGTMPTVNKQAVINAIRVANALHMEIDHQLNFDRKNYFYSDLPKGFQITQQFRPLGKNGYVEVGNKKISIERLHIEEDTCKQLHFQDYTLLDYNRAGTPLIEIVSCPEIRTGKEAMEYVEQIRSIVVYAGVSDGKMEEGSLRCDVNISLRPIGSDRFYNKVEIKNLNSLANVQRAIDYEIKRQSALLYSGGIVEQETRRFDESKKATVCMRKKSDSVDYKYFPEVNIAPINLSEEFVQEAIDTCPELASSKKQRYIDLGLSNDEAKQILASYDNSIYFDKCLECTSKASIKTLWNFICVDIVSYLNKNNIDIKSFIVTPTNVVSLIELIDAKEISYAQARKIFEVMVKDNEHAKDIQERLGFKQNSNVEEITLLCKQILENNPQSIADYKAGKDRAVGYLVGQVMKASKGKANPQLVSKIILELLGGK